MAADGPEFVTFAKRGGMKSHPALMSPITIYADLMSQPCRAVVWFCLLNNIPHNMVLMRIDKGEHRTEEFAKINPHKKLPVIDDHGVVLYESHAILRYLHEMYVRATPYYPADLAARGKIDQYLDWHHANTRKGMAGLVWTTFLGPKLGMKYSPEQVEQARKAADAAFEALETVFLADSHFIGGAKASLADLSAYCEVKQLILIDYEWESRYPKVAYWYKRCDTLPRAELVNHVIEKAAAKIRGSKL